MIPAYDLTENDLFIISGRTGEDLEAWEYPFTTRVRFLFWLGMRQLTDQIRMMVVDGQLNEFVTSEFPPFVRNQPILWWHELFLAGRRLTEAARTGEGLATRTPGEEALVYRVCLDRGDFHFDIMAADDDWGRELKARYEALPVMEADESGEYEDWRGVAEGLAGDLDIEDVWNSERALNGDYAAERWFAPWLNSEITILAEQYRAIEERLKVAIPELHEVGNSWASIGSMLGISRQAAWERYGKNSTVAHEPVQTTIDTYGALMPTVEPGRSGSGQPKDDA